MDEATALHPISPTVAAHLAVAAIGVADLSVQTAARLAVLVRQFETFVVRGHGISSLSEVTASVIESFVNAPTADLVAPGSSLRYFRRLAVRHLFRVCREHGFDVGDPTVDVVLPSRNRAAFRPLEDDEVKLCRAIAVTMASTRPSAGWALCEATARTAEVAAVTVGDVDLDAGRVWLHGAARLDERWGELTEWGLLQVRRHLNTLPDSPETLLFDGGLPGTSIAQSSAVGLIGRTLRRAGFGDDPAMRPSSIAVWAGHRVFVDSGRIEIAAQRLGMRSLDRAAVFIGWDWNPGAD